VSLRTDQQVQIRTGERGEPLVYVDGELLQGVTRVQMDHTYDKGMAAVTLTILSVDIDMAAAPDWLVRVVGPSPKPPE
jgi:hypothetical protein